MKKVTERLQKQLKSSWRRMLVSLARLTARVQDKLEASIVRLPAQ